MTLTLEDQQNQTIQPGFQARVEAASVAQAIVSFAAPPASGAAQAQRIGLANAILRAPGYAVTQFAWVLVTRPALNAIDDLTDNFVTSTVAAVFDKVAQQLIEVPP